MSYINFINYSTYSKSLGFLKIHDLINLQKHYNSDYAVLTDHMTCMGYPEFENACVANDKKPIFGLSVSLENKKGSLVLIALDSEGVSNLKKIVSEQNNDNDPDSFITMDVLKKYSDSLVALEGFDGSVLNLLTDDSEKEQYMNFLMDTYNKKIMNCVDPRVPNRNTIPDNYNIPKMNSYPIRVLKEEHIPLLKQKRVSLKFYQDNPDVHTFSDKDFPVSPKELNLEYSKNNNALTKRIKEHSNFKDPEFPKITDMDLRTVLKNTWRQFIKKINKEDIPSYKERLNQELQVIEKMKFEDYFLTVASMAKYSKENDLPHVIRGSGASSLVGYILEISSVDPIKNGLLFERFLNETRALQGELPDMDFDSSNPKAIVHYLKNTIGKDKISTVSAISTIKRWDVTANHVGTAYPDINIKKHINYIKKQIDRNYTFNQMGMSELMKNLSDLNPKVKSYYSVNDEFKRFVDYTIAFEKQVVNNRRGPSGYILSNKPLKGEVSLIPDKESYTDNYVELSKPDVEKSGFIKMDILPNHHIGYNYTAYKNMDKLSLLNSDVYSDMMTFDLFKKGFVTGLYQMTKIGKDISQSIQPESFSDIVALQALIRPGVPKNEIDLFIKNKNDNAHKNYSNPILKNILGETYGVLIYEEQLMKIAQDIGGLSPDDSDYFRRLVKKKDAESVEKYCDIIISNGIKNETLSDKQSLNLKKLLMGKIQGYMFNKAHATVYADICYKEAYVKAHYPGEFITYYIDSKDKNKDRIEAKEKYFQELLERNVIFNSPYINKISQNYTTTHLYHTQPDNTKKKEMIVIPSLNSISGENFSKIILKERLNNGSFSSFYNFVERFYSAYLEENNSNIFENMINKNKTVDSLLKKNISHLVSLGLFDEFADEKTPENIVKQRNIFLNSIDSAFELAQKPFIDEPFVYSDNDNKHDVEFFIEEEKKIFSFSPLAIYNQKRVNKQTLNKIKP